MKRILLVDGKTESRIILEKILKTGGYKTISAANGAEALEIALKNSPDMVITDILMPVMDGFTLCREWRRNEMLQNIPFIFYTATYTDPKDEEFALSLGADRFLTKPQEMSFFLKIIKETFDANKGKKKQAVPAPEEKVFLKEYNESLVRKLEDKMTQLEATEKELREKNAAFEKDIEEGKRVEETLALLSHTFKSINECISITDSQNRILFVNQAFMNTYGYTQEELIGKPIYIVRVDARPGSDTILQKTLSGGWHGELLNRKKDGTVFPVSLSTSVVYDGKNQPVALVGIASDITDRKRAEEELQNERNLLRIVIDNLPDLFQVKDAQARYLLNNRAHLKSLEMKSQEDTIGKTAFDFHPYELAKQYYEDEMKVINTGEPLIDKEEFVFRHEMKELRCHLTSKIPLKDSQGKVTGLIVITHDITERKQAEESLRESRALYQSFVEHLPAGVFRKDSEGRYVFINSRFCQLKGLRADEILGKTPRELAAYETAMATIRPPEMMGTQRTLALQGADNHELIMRTGKPIELEEVYPQPDGTTQYFYVVKSPVFDSNGNVIGTQGVQFDVTDRKRTEAELQKSEAQLSNAIKIAKLGPWEYDVVKDLFTFNDNFFAIFRTTSKQVGGYTMSSARYAKQFVHPDDLPIVGEEIKKALETTDPDYSRQLEHRIIYADGEIGYIAIRIFVVKDEQGRTIKTYGVNQDITERKRAEEALRESENKYRDMVEQINDVLFATDVNGRYTYVSPTVEVLEGYKQDEMIGHFMFEFIDPAFLPNVKEQFIKVMTGTLEPSEYRVKNKTGEYRWVRNSSKPIIEKGMPVGVRGVLTEITARKKAEESINLLSHTMKSVTECVSVTDLNNTILFVNQAFLDTYGYTEEEILGKNIKVIANTKGADIQAILTSTTNHSGWHGELVNRKKDGTEFPIYLSTSVVLDELGKEIALVGIATDITERKRAEEAIRESEEKFRMVFENVFDGISLYDEDPDPSKRKLIECNERYAAMAGRSREELLKIGNTQVLQTAFNESAEDARQESLSKKTAFRGSFSWIRPDEKYNIVEYVGAPITWRGKRYSIGIDRDITERQQAIEALEAERDLLNTLINNLPDYIFIKDIKSRILMDNIAHRRVLGATTLEEVVGKTDFDFFPQEMAASYYSDEQEIIHKGEALINREELTINPGGKQKWLLTSKVPLRNRQGMIMGIVGISHDNTEHKQEEEKIRKLNRIYAVLSNINQLIVRERDNQKLLDSACKIAIKHGKFQMIWIGLLDETNGTIHSSAHAGSDNTYLDDLHKIKVNTQESEAPCIKAIREGRNVLYNNIENIQSGGLWRERALTLGYKSTASFVLRVSSKIIGTINYFSHEPDYFDKDEVTLLEELALDVSYALESMEMEKKRKRVEEALAREQYLMNTLMDNIPDHIYFKDTDSRFIRISKSQAEIFGLSDSVQAIGKSDFSFFSEEHARFAFRDEQEIVRTGKPIVNLEEKETWPDGRETWVLTTKEPLRDKKGQIIGTFGISRDITERKRAEEVVLLQNTALQSAANAILITDRDGRIVSVNRAFSQFTGYSQEEVIGKKTSILKSGKQSPSFYQDLWETILSGFVWKGELENKRKDGSLYTEEMTITPVYDIKGQISHFIAIKQDITEQKKLHNQIMQTQKVQSIGTLAGGIAHDFNNILGIIMAFTSILEKSKGDMQKILKSTNAITQAVNRGSALTRQILTFARQTGITVGSISIPVLIRELLGMLKETFPPVIEFQTDIEKNIPFINADSSQMHQVLLNLCVNARDAMPKGGTITIKVNVVPLERIIKQFPGADIDRYICLSVTDTGIGMDETTKSRIFDPFFTTKELGKGTGLGLSVVFGVIQDHHGFISVDSEPGKGTTFQLYLPVPQESKNQKEMFISEVEQTQGGSETILFVEDEELLREAVQSSLESNGYKVLLAVDGREAVDIYKERYKDISLVLTDMGLPKLSGIDEYALIKDINPKAKVIFASGFIALESRSELLKGGVKGFIQKPYIMDEIFQMVREVLDEKEG